MAGETLVTLSRRAEHTAYAHKYFEEHIAALYGDVPPPALKRQEEAYVVAALVNPEALRQLEELYRPQAEKATPAVIAEDVFVTLRDSQGQEVENYARSLGKDVPAGIYEGSYYNESTQEEERVTVTVDSSGGTLVQPLSAEGRSSESFSEPVAEEASGLSTAVKHQVEDLVELAETSSSADRMTLLEAARGMEETLAKADRGGSLGGAISKRALEDLQMDYNSYGHRADAEGKAAVAEAWWTASERLADLLEPTISR
jgi:hypothetical protein